VKQGGNSFDSVVAVGTRETVAGGLGLGQQEEEEGGVPGGGGGDQR
jgi:hypothetical protein